MGKGPRSDSEIDRQSAPLAIQLLGSYDLRLYGAPLPPLRSRKGYWLLTLLVLRKGRAVERDWLAGTLWPDSSNAQALFNLRRNLTDLRHALGSEAHRLQAPIPHTLCFDMAGAQADVVAFDAAIARGDVPSLKEAVRLYRGPLAASCTEDWIQPERTAREQAYLQALETLAEFTTARGDHPSAAHYLRLAVAVDSLREQAQRALMQSLAAGGDYAAATLVYREFRERLHREAAAAPGPETVELFQQISARARAAVRRPDLRSHGRTPTDRPAADLSPSVDDPPPNLPRPMSGFVGREDELSEIETCLAAARLVTLTGPGGVGKTRLAIQVAAEVADQFPGGVRFVDLGALVDPALVPQVAAQAMSIPEMPGSPLIETLVSTLRYRRCLVVLDNCEHLIDACAQLVNPLLHGCQDLRVLATSRQSLGITGEIVWRVPPLSLPPPVEEGRLDVEGSADIVSSDHPRRAQPQGTALQLSALQQYEAVRLFVERGTAATRSFALSERNVAATVELCRRLDGMPLAIELAAARLNALTVGQIAARLNDRFRLLTGGSRTSLPRQQTLRATIDWSYDLLDEPERAAPPAVGICRRLHAGSGRGGLRGRL